MKAWIVRDPLFALVLAVSALAVIGAGVLLGEVLTAPWLIGL